MTAPEHPAVRYEHAMSPIAQPYRCTVCSREAAEGELVRDTVNIPGEPLVCFLRCADGCADGCAK